MKKKHTSLPITAAIAALFLLFTSALFGQTPPEKIAFEKYGVAEGLPEEFISSMVQDKQGFMWFTTQNGLVKFDGYKIKVYKATEYQLNSNKLALRNLNGQIIKGKNGNLWIGGVGFDGSISSFDPKTEKFKNYRSKLNDSTSKPLGGSLLMFEDIKNNIWYVNHQKDIDTSVIARLNTKTHKIKIYSNKVVGSRVNDIVLNGNILESETDKNIWIKDVTGNLLVLNREKDEFDQVISAGSEIPGSGVTDTIRNIIKGGKDHFLISGDHSLIIWDPVKKQSIKSYTNLVDKDNTLSSNKINYGFEDIKGQYWVIHENGNITLIDPVNNTNTKLTYGEGLLNFKEGLKGPIFEFWPIFQNQNGIWFHFWNEPEDAFLFYRFSTNSFTYYNQQLNDSKNSLIRPAGIFNMLEDETGILWLGDRPNFYKQSPKTRQMELYNHDPVNANSIPSDTITRIVEDSKQRLWVGTHSGLSTKLDDNTFKQYYFRDAKGKQKDLGRIMRIYEDSKEQIWIGTLMNGLLRLNESKQEFQHIEAIKGDIVNSINEDNNNALWVSSYDQGVYVLDTETAKLLRGFETDTKDAHGLLSNQISTMFLDSRGIMWLGDNGYNKFGLFKYDEKDNNFKHYQSNNTDSLTLNSNEIRTIIEDDRNRMWVGTDEGVNLYDPEKDVFYKTKGGFDISSSRVMTKATKGKVWVATYASGGLSLVGPNINDIEMFGEDKGLLHNDATNLVFDNLGKLWLPTERGLSVFDTLTKTYTSYFEKDGFQKNGNVNTILKTQNGDIWIGGRNGLNRIVPEKLFKKDLTKPAVYITTMGIMDSTYSAASGSLFNKAVSYTDQVKLKYWQKDLSFDFVGLHYLNPEDNQYSWKLENYDNKWSTPSKERRAAYTNLSSGTYTFLVKASNADGIWNEEGASIHITIAPPWWQTWWAYGIYFLLLLFLGYRLHLYQKARTLKKAQEEAQKKELEQAKEIEKAYTELKSTQSQLIQSEKMASLGELTAGIAHEIQNPLNFVNNFSEVNRELIEELKEEKAKTKKARDEKLEEELLTDIDQNLEKISHHGKRADSIVKGMLQHSRSSNGVKEPTDINAMADEYLRLAYHGLRAKDNSFNASMETDFNKSVGMINVVPQDIGRVVLNLITNAFYVVNEKSSSSKASGDTKYEPTVSVSTKKVGKKVEIKVMDNGNGIPKKALDKIFQPFFTTKPTGQGTGLGLSLSYDIVKAHGGELKVQTNEGEGSQFIIILPV